MILTIILRYTWLIDRLTYAYFYVGQTVVTLHQYLMIFVKPVLQAIYGGCLAATWLLEWGQASPKEIIWKDLHLFLCSYL